MATHPYSAILDACAVIDISLSKMPLLAAADAPSNAPLCKPKFSGIAVISDM